MRSGINSSKECQTQTSKSQRTTASTRLKWITASRTSKRKLSRTEIFSNRMRRSQSTRAQSSIIKSHLKNCKSTDSFASSLDRRRRTWSQVSKYSSTRAFSMLSWPKSRRKINFWLRFGSLKTSLIMNGSFGKKSPLLMLTLKISSKRLLITTINYWICLRKSSHGQSLNSSRTN